MPFPDDFQAQAPGSPYAPVKSRTAQGYDEVAEQIEAIAARLSHLADALRERGADGGNQGNLAQARQWAAMLAGATDGLDFIL